MPVYDSYYVQEEDGTGHFLLEDESGALIIETATLVTPSVAAVASGDQPILNREIAELLKRQRDDEEALLLVLTTL